MRLHLMNEATFDDADDSTAAEPPFETRSFHGHGDLGNRDDRSHFEHVRGRKRRKALETRALLR